MTLERAVSSSGKDVKIERLPGGIVKAGRKLELSGNPGCGVWKLVVENRPVRPPKAAFPAVDLDMLRRHGEISETRQIHRAPEGHREDEGFRRRMAVRERLYTPPPAVV